jgi:hypothetical protein
MSNLIAELRTIHEELTSLTQVFDDSKIREPLPALTFEKLLFGSAARSGWPLGDEHGVPTLSHPVGDQWQIIVPVRLG